MSILEYMQKAMREDQKLKKTLTTDKKTDKNRAPPLTEEHVYDYDGEQMIRDAIREARDMSISPERDSPRRRDRSPSPGKKYSNNSSKITPEEHRPKDPRLMRSKNTEDPRQKKRTVIDYDTYSSRDRRRDRSRSPVERKSREITPPPMPPGMDWPFEAPKNDLEWKQKDDRSRDRDYQDDVNRKLKSKMREERRESPEPPKPTSGSNSESLSIEETNKLRAKLGMKPLEVDSDTKSAPPKKSYADRDDVHAPAGNISQQKSAEQMREKMEAIREKRKQNKKLQKVRGLGDDDPVIESAAEWVARSRKQERDKEMADKRAQMLMEMDEEFGVSDIVESTLGREIKKEPTYSARDLSDLKVQHRMNAFQEGANTILTLADRGILDDDDEDVLMNVNIVDAERAKKNVENRTKKPGYKAYDEVDDDTGMLKVRGVLDKYDEEIEGEKKHFFRLDGTGQADHDDELDLERIRDNLKSQQVTLDMAAPQLARDYFTEEEMVKFKKPRKKVRKVRKRAVLKADDLLKIDVDQIQDRGSRKGKSILKNNSGNQDSGVEDMQIAPTVPDELDYFVATNLEVEGSESLVDDEAGNELQMALERSRRQKQKKEENPEDDQSVHVEKMAQTVLALPPKIEPKVSKKKNKSTIILDSTSEFCRTLGELPTIGEPAKQEEEEEQEPMDEDEVATNGWEQVQVVEGKKANVNSVKEEEDDQDEDVLEPEPLPMGMAATLNLATMKGYLGENKAKHKFDPLNLPETMAEVDVEKLRDEEKSRYSSRGYERDRDRYDPHAFKDKTNYKPNVKLNYVDDKGRNLSQKEAFRLLSHKFHGKGSGKLKTEKRAKKLQEQRKLQTMSSIDTPLNTSAMFKDKQEKTQSPYLVLSGGGKNLLSGETLTK